MRTRSGRTLAAAALAACVSVVVAGAIAPATARAQAAPDAPASCRAQACAIVVDWGSGKSSATYPADRRYGSGDDFESKVRFALNEHGLRMKEPPAGNGITMTLRTTMRAKVMCTDMPGVNTDKSCTAMTDLAVSFTSGDPAVKAPGAIRIANRCGSPDVYMTMAQFAQYSADMIYYNLEGSAKKEPKPLSKCY